MMPSLVGSSLEIKEQFFYEIWITLDNAKAYCTDFP